MVSPAGCHICIMHRYYISQQFVITLCIGITFRNEFYITFRAGITFRNNFVLHYA